MIDQSEERLVFMVYRDAVTGEAAADDAEREIARGKDLGEVLACLGNG